MELERHVAEMLSSSIVLILTLFVISVFIFYGFTVPFYVLLVITFAFALFNAWFIANSEKKKGTVKVSMEELNKKITRTIGKRR